MMKIRIIPNDPSADKDVDPPIPEAVAAGIPTPPPESRRVISIADLCHQCNDQAGKMSRTNPNKKLLFDCAYALQQLVQRLDFHESKVRKQ